MKQATSKKAKAGKIAIAVTAAAAAAAGALALLNHYGDTDPTEYKGQRSGYENTK